MNPDHTADRVHILHTMSVYAISVDCGDVDGVVSVFMPDGRLELSGGASAVGRAAIRAFYTPLLAVVRPDGALPLLRHNLTSSRVEFVDADTASCRTYFMSVTPYGLDTCGHYVDTFRRHGTRWLVDRRCIVVDWYASPSWYESARLKAVSRGGG